ncbi:YfhO family protein [Neobacillus niacini]|uniref:YfhO family protein n=1 Tax=Neobacillus niacini TaxID=86668 RepID=UPI0021CB368C|nr:YfhO family protein [Neobacillus niacini]MCM3763511.1 YfhO family protein [Neobacillus niacini]
MKRIYPLLLFFSPIAIVLIAFFLLKIIPFGPNTIWYIDLPYQINLFYTHLYDVFHGQGSIIYAWNYGMGTNFWPTFCYYLSSPLSILIVFFPRDFIPQGVIFIYLLKLGLASLTISFMLKRVYGLGGTVNFSFSLCYSLVSFAITYYFLPMWLDSIYLLPLLIFSVHQILRNNRYKLFLFTLTILFISNFYISYATGIFIFLYFVLHIYLGTFSKGEIVKKFTLFFSSVFLAVCFSMFILLPTYLQIKNNNYGGTDHNLGGFSFNPIDIYQKFFIGTTEVQNLSLYAGLIVILLVPLYFLNSKYSLKERMAHLVLLSFLLISIASNLLNFIWHLFEIPNGAFYRFAFLISFYVIVLSVKSFIAIDRKMLPHLVKIYGFNVLFICFLNKILDPNFFTVTEMYVNIFILTAVFIILVIKMTNVQFKYNSLVNILLLCVIAVDLLSNSFLIFRNYTVASAPDQWDEAHNPAYEHVINHIAETDKELYRVNSELISTENESLRYRYNGMNIYSSTGNGRLNDFLSSLGYTAHTRAVNMRSGIFVSDVMFGFRYKISLNPKDERIYTKVFEEGKVKAYRNNYSLPLGFMVNEEQFTSLGNQLNWMEKQNSLIGSYNGHSSYYSKYSAELVDANNLSFDPKTKIFTKINPKNQAFIEYKLNIKDLMQIYLQLNDEDYKNFGQLYSVSLEGKKLESAKMDFLNFVDLGTFEKQEITVRFEFSDDTQSVTQPEFYTLNYTLLGKRIEEINQSTFQIADFTNTKITGNIEVKDNKVLFLSIPYDDNWKIKVDGKQVDSVKLGEFLGVPLSKGSHELELTYSPTVFYLSLIFSAGMLVCYLVWTKIFKKEGV